MNAAPSSWPMAADGEPLGERLPRRPPGCHPGRWLPFLPYLPALLMVALALALGLQGGLWSAGTAGGAAVLSFLTVEHLRRQKREAERQRAESEAQLWQSQKLAAIGELSAGIAHEINNPLAIIRQEAEWLLHLLRQGPAVDPAELETSLTVIIEAVDRGRDITHNLLDFARRRQPVIQAVDVNRIVEDMTRLIAKEAQNRQIVIHKDLQPDLPQIFSDAPQLRQVVLNLLNNALQAIEREGTVTVRTRAADARAISIEIEDTGCGIPREHLPRIFDPFFTTKPQGKGTGLGLSICHGIISRLGGEITVKSEVGKGSSFRVTLPVRYRPKEV